MMMLISFAFAWAVIRAFEQMGVDARTGGREARARYQRRVRNKAKLRAQRIRARGWRHPERWALAAGVGASVAARTAVRGARHAGRSATTGWAKGWAEGKTRHTAHVDRRGERRAAAQKGVIDGAGELHFGADPDDPNGVRVCDTCRGRAVVGRPPRPCPECQARQRRRNELHAANDAARDEVARHAKEAAELGGQGEAARPQPAPGSQRRETSERPCAESGCDEAAVPYDVVCRHHKGRENAEVEAEEAAMLRAGQCGWMEFIDMSGRYTQYCGKTTAPGSTYCPRHTLRARGEDDRFLDRMRDGEFDPDDEDNAVVSGDAMRWSPDGTETPDHPAGQTETPTGDGGTPVSTPNGQAPTGEATNIESARQALQALARIGEQANTAADQLSASLASADMDADTLGEVSVVLEAADSLKAAASAALTGLDRRHQVMEEAVNSTPHAARTDFYRH